MIYFTGCTHFGHANIIKMAKRPFTSAEEMDEVMIENWNKVVGKRDTVYHLGDFARLPSRYIDYFNRLNGKVILLRGNHDPKAWGQDYIEIEHEKRKIVLCHYPIEEWNGWFRNSVHLHCHTHSQDRMSAIRRYNVGVDANWFRPVRLETVLETIDNYSVKHGE